MPPVIQSVTAPKRSVPEVELREWATCLEDPEASLVARSRALWGLRHADEPLALDLLAKFLCDYTGSSPKANALLQHEVAYCLGQRGQPDAVPHLLRIVTDEVYAPIVRHEAAEALAALCEVAAVDVPAIKSVLTDHINSPVVELAETCQVGIERIQWLSDNANQMGDGVRLAKQFFPNTVDPAPGLSQSERPSDPTALRDCIIDPSKPLFARYRALFSLRDCILEALTRQRSSESTDPHSSDALALLMAEGLQAPNSALLRHEVSFVLGQLAMPVTVPDLADSVQRETEHPWVRHEAAEALGAVLGRLESANGTSDSTNAEEVETFTKAARCVLQQFAKDDEVLVRESCVLALDMADYVASPGEFQYARVPS